MLNTSQNTLEAFSGTKRRSIKGDTLQFKKVLCMKDQIYEFTYYDKTSQLNLIFKLMLTGSEDDIKKTKIDLNKIGFQFKKTQAQPRSETNHHKESVDSSSLSPEPFDQFESYYRRLSLTSRTGKETALEIPIIDISDDSSNSLSSNSNSVISLYDIFKSKREKEKSKERMNKSQTKTSKQETIYLANSIIFSGKNMIERISKFFRISPIANTKYDFRIASDIRAMLPVKLRTNSEYYPLDFFSLKSLNIFYSTKMGFKELRDKVFIMTVTDKNRKKRQNERRRKKREVNFIPIDKYVKKLASFNMDIGEKVTRKEFSRSKINTLYKSLLNKEKSGNIGFEFREKYKRLINMYLTNNFDFNVHFKFIRLFYALFRFAIKQFEDLIVSYFSFKNKHIKIDSFFVFLIKLFLSEISLLKKEFVSVFSELISSSNYCELTKDTTLQRRQNQLFKAFVRALEIEDKLFIKKDRDIKEKDLNVLLGFLRQREFKKLTFLEEEMIKELNKLKNIK